MYGRTLVEFISFILNLLVYPIALSPLIVRIVSREECRASRRFLLLTRLLIFSTVLAASSSLQLFFGHIDLLANLHSRTRAIFFQVFAFLFLSGAYLFVSRLSTTIQILGGMDGKPRRVEKIIHGTTLLFVILAGSLLILQSLPFVTGLSTLLAFLLTGVYILFALSIGLSTYRMFLNRKENPYFRRLLLLIMGDGALLLLTALMPSNVTPISISLLFLFHFQCLYSMLMKCKPTPGKTISSRDEKIGRLVQSGLSERESEIALSLMEGLPYKDISDRHCISLSTVQTHVSNIYGKLGVNSKIGLLSYFEKL